MLCFSIKSKRYHNRLLLTRVCHCNSLSDPCNHHDADDLWWFECHGGCSNQYSIYVNVRLIFVWKQSNSSSNHVLRVDANSRSREGTERRLDKTPVVIISSRLQVKIQWQRTSGTPEVTSHRSRSGCCNNPLAPTRQTAQRMNSRRKEQVREATRSKEKLCYCICQRRQ